MTEDSPKKGLLVLIQPDHSIRRRAGVILFIGLLLRVILALYTSHPATMENISAADLVYLDGINPFVWTRTVGTSFYVFYLPLYIPYLVLSDLGARYQSLLTLFFKMSPIGGDILTFYALYRIALIVTKSERKALAVGVAYYLNPYIIFMSSIVGHFDQLMMSFVLLSVLSLLSDKIGRGAFYLAIATFFRYLVVFAVPIYFVYLWSRTDVVGRPIQRFVGVYAIVSSVLLAPSIFVAITLQSYPVALSSFLASWIVPVAGSTSGYVFAGTLQPETFKYNFTGVAATLGLWPTIGPFLGLRTFLVVYTVITVVFASKFRDLGVRLFSRYLVAIFSSFILLIPLAQHNYLLWVFPFLLVEGRVFNRLPRYYVHALWITNLIIDPLLSGGFLHYFGSFPGLWFSTLSWPLDNHVAEAVVSTVFASFLVLALLKVVGPFWRRADLDVVTDPALRYGDQGSEWRPIENVRPRNPFGNVTLRTIFLVSVLVASASLYPLVFAANQSSHWQPTIGFYSANAQSSTDPSDSSNQGQPSSSWRVSPYVLPFVPDQTKVAIIAWLGILPPPTSIPYNLSTTWSERNFTVSNEVGSWSVTEGGGSVNTDNGLLIELGGLSNFLTIALDQNRTFRSDIANSIELEAGLVRNSFWRLSAFVGGSWQLLRDLDGNYRESSPGTFLFVLPPSISYTHLSLTIENAANASNGAVEIRQVKIGHAEFPNVEVEVADKAIINGPASLLRSYTTWFDASGRGPFLRIPINATLLTPDIEVRLAKSAGEWWNVRVVGLILLIDQSNLKAFWLTIPFWLVFPVVSFSELVLAVWLLNRLRKWFFLGSEKIVN